MLTMLPHCIATSTLNMKMQAANNDTAECRNLCGLFVPAEAKPLFWHDLCSTVDWDALHGEGPPERSV